jgi:hypothetical protein
VWFLAAGLAVRNVFLGRRAWTKTSRLIPTSAQIQQPHTADAVD